MHAAAYLALGLPHSYDKLETSLEELASRVDALRSGTVAGLNVTVPHKTNVLALVDSVDASASATGAANTLVRFEGGTVRAYNTDAPALRDEIRRLAKSPDMFRGRSALVLGTGGAARAAIFALGELGVARVIVRGRRQKDELGGVLAASGSSATLVFQALDAPPSDPDDLAVVVQATTAGMDGAAVPGEIVARAVDWAKAPPDCVVYDVVYVPPRTPLLVEAAARGLACDSGLGMLVRQGALAFELWLGVPPPLDVMRAALG
ncbi:MAG: Shikimate 5-dehydrogenase alpha [Labilithrix sp.]|nr:Shikimate 5-dehydrogenase alpha [Labilithrix sp.]